MDRPPLAKRYQARRCTAEACGLRFPVEETSDLGASCPLCGVPTERVDAPYQTFPANRGEPRALTIEVLLDNVRSLTNVGSIFRTADGAGVAHIHLGGITPTPKHPKLAKTALGAERSVPWTHHPDPCKAASALAARGHRLWALEANATSASVFALETLQAASGPADATIVLVVGHEVSGVDPRILALCERVVHVPMQGVKGSLNVGVAFGVVTYTLRHHTGPSNP